MSRVAFVCCFFFICLFSFNVSAQKDSARYYSIPSISGSIGLGLSLRNLNPASNQVWMDFVKPGFNTSLSAELPLFHSHFGARASFSYYHNSFDMPRFLKKQDSATPYTTATSISYGAFNQYTLLLGGSYSFYTRKGKAVYNIWLECGAEYLSLPNTEVNYSISQPAQSNWNSTVIYTANPAFAIDGGISSSYRLHKKWWISISWEFLVANVNYADTRYDVYIQHIQYTKAEAGTALMEMVSLNAGIRYLL